MVFSIGITGGYCGITKEYPRIRGITCKCVILNYYTNYGGNYFEIPLVSYGVIYPLDPNAWNFWNILSLSVRFELGLQVI